ncbi:RimK family alpha-L-glutamate ligase [uncultured Jatrophihabitans sp.]|uniref:ATP-grasp domain-containing protein n=1 Tax=uncultured Jatrophihabitans sp. TaxID=1610747 RepID=UPI0035C9AF1A
MSRVLLATCGRLPVGDEDAGLLESALRTEGIDPVWAVWDDPGADWATDLVVLRSTWDYTARRADFLSWAAAVPRLANSADVVDWNSDKVYLADLAGAGVPVVATSTPNSGDTAVFPPAAEVVVKPSVGSGSRDVGRFRTDEAGLDAARTHVDRLRDGGYTALVQPYLADVDTRGETALVYVEGRFSHAARKGPMLAAGHAPFTGDDTPERALYKAEAIAAREPDAAELAVGEQALAAVRARFGTPLYARVDLLPAPDGPVVVELELVEPSLFLAQADHAAATFAAAIAARA